MVIAGTRAVTGIADSFLYTNDDSINEADTTGAWTTTFNEGAASEGEGTRLAGGIGIGLRRDHAPPVNMQIEEEFNSNPPWAAPSAYDTVQAEEGPGWSIQPGAFIFDAGDGGGKDKVNHKSGPNAGGTGPCRSGGKVVNGRCQPGKGGGPSKKSCAVQAGAEAVGGVVGIFFLPIGAVSAGGAIITVADCA
jgi:hypothetical protein